MCTASIENLLQISESDDGDAASNIYVNYQTNVFMWRRDGETEGDEK